MAISTISLAVSTLKSLSELFKTLSGSYSDAETKERIIDALNRVATIQTSLFEIQNELIHLQEENRQQKKKIIELEARRDLEGRIVYEKPFYWVLQDNQSEGPFCQKCWDVDRLTVRLQACHSDDVWQCRNCNSTYPGPNYQRRGLAPNETLV